jgi:hypothetical protein
MALVTDDFSMESRFSSVAGRIFRRREGVVAWWADLAEVWDTMLLRLEGSADVSPERTVVLFTLTGVGTASGVRLDEPIAQRWYWRGELIAQIEYMDRAEAELIVRGSSA